MKGCRLGKACVFNPNGIGNSFLGEREIDGKRYRVYWCSFCQRPVLCVVRAVRVATDEETARMMDEHEAERKAEQKEADNKERLP